MLSKVVTAAFILSRAYSAYAHGAVTSYSIGGVTYPGYQAFSGQTSQATAERKYPSYDPILNALDANMACNNNGGTGNPLQTDITIAAGSDITAYWPQWTHAEGPVTVYLAKCPGSSCTGVSNVGLKWFKIQESGLISGTVGAGQWGNGIVLKTLKWTTTIPSCLAPGPYLIRHELLALHQSNTPQFYPECAQLIITGSGSSVPSNTVSIPGAWGASDPGVKIDIYGEAAKTQTTYQVPGPAVWTCGGTSPTTTKPVTTSTPTTTKSTTTTTPSPSATGTVPHYGQCGGIGWTGATVCASPYTCVKNGDYYSQCV